ncbi:hypothetical protein ACPOL_1896 [Acidisarcina polymorpha]|uniref:Uncharacterized protein n=1 Tax=Acidisarcina polymorpha TaxID=2211140 RepID=A0A2Z5FXK2_9BACT|nr:hypothetical protein ACPOL_1896 [Acidisarcina polymorpha]
MDATVVTITLTIDAHGTVADDFRNWLEKAIKRFPNDD